MTAPIFKITNGTTEIDLTGQAGPYCLIGWEQIIANLKGGGVFQDSPIAEGSRLVAGELGNVEEVITLSAGAGTQDDLIEQAGQDLFRLLNDMRDYWTEAQTRQSPVYLIAKSSRETNTRYALIHNYRIPSFPSAFHQPFLQSIGSGASYSSSDIIINRGQWMANAPGVGNDVVISSFQEWQPEEWESSNSGNFDGGVVRDIVQKESTGDLYLITAIGTTDTDGRVYKSINSGVSWTNILSFGGGRATRGGSLLVADDGAIYAGTQTNSTNTRYIRKTINDGTSWSTVSTILTVGETRPYIDLFQSVDGSIYANSSRPVAFTLYRGSSTGTGWALVLEVTTNGGGGRLTQLTDARILVTGKSSSIGDIRASFTGDIFTWGLISNQGTSPRISDIVQLTTGRILYINDSNQVYSSDNNGVTWTQIVDITGSSTISRISQISTGRVYAVFNDSNIYFSDDFGDIWSPITTSGSLVACFLETSDGTLWAGADDELFTLTPSTTMGNSQKVLVSNKQNKANITEIKLFNSTAVTYTDKFPVTASFELFPAVNAVGDIVYFGIDATLVNTGTFSSLVFNNTQIVVGLTFTWEYYNGGWVSLTVTDNTNGFVNLGINSVVFETPSDWIPTTVDTVSAYWIRLSVVTRSGVNTSPEQDDDQIYTVVQPYIEGSSTSIGGDIKALVNLEILNVSDLDGVGGGAPPLYDNRILTGNKIIDIDNEDFTMFVNASTLQNLAGITATVGTNTVISTNIVTPSTEEIVYTPLGTEVLADRLTFTLSTTIARNFYGIYRLFLRGQQVGGSSGDIFMAAVIQSGSGGIKKTTEQVIFETNEDWSLIDFGKIEIPVSSNILSSELADVISITIQAGSVDAVPVLHIYDIVLLPVDGVWSGDFIDRQNLPGSSEIKNNYSLNLDSISNPKGDRSIVVNESTGFITAEYQAIATPPRLPNNKRFRQYFLAAIYGPLGEWVSLPSVVHCINLQATQRYLLGRGSR